MESKHEIEYPAFIYRKNNIFVANCVMYNMMSIGRTKSEAIHNLEESMSKALSDYNIAILPVCEINMSHKASIN